jgi:hypothetical protein
LGIKILVSVIGKDETAENYAILLENNKLTEEDLERFDHSLLHSIGITEAWSETLQLTMSRQRID